MDFNLSEDDLEFKKMARDFAKKRLYPRAEEFDEKEITPPEVIQESKGVESSSRVQVLLDAMVAGATMAMYSEPAPSGSLRRSSWPSSIST